MTRIFLFPGQGSQKKGMGAGLFELFPELVEQAETVLGYSLRTLCLEDPDGKLGETQCTQPALFVVNALTALRFIAETGKSPDFVAGHSVGEYNALFAAGAFDWMTGVKLVAKRGEIMSRADSGAMAAIIVAPGTPAEKIRIILDQAGLGAVDIANFNSPSQIVISGLKEDIARAEGAFRDAGVRHFIPLPVSGAFHSRYMQPSRKEFEIFLDHFEFHDLKIPVLSNVTAGPYEQGAVKEMLLEQITSPVRWSESVTSLLKIPEPEFFEMGPGAVLSGLLKQIRRSRD